MFKNLFFAYDQTLDARLQQALIQDFRKADKKVMLIISIFCVAIALLTPLQHGYFSLGMLGGGVIFTISMAAYLILSGTVLCRLIFATSLAGITAITVQQANGLGEGHFVFFISITVLILYRDVIPMLALVAFIVFHHLLGAYCQSQNIALFGQTLTVFSWGQGSFLGLMAPFFYHVGVALVAIGVGVYYILDGNKRFIESSLVFSAIEEAASGNISSPIQTHQDLPLVQLTNQFLHQLRESIQKTTGISERMHAQASDTSLSAQQLSEQAHNQQHEISVVSASVQEMSTATQEIARLAEKTAHTASRSVDLSAKGRAQVTTCKDSIESLVEHFKDSATMVRELADNSQKIHTIVSTISGIAEQTNLLALNAAIEAARAGEQGRGFAVVADEVRVLSQRTHSSTAEISNMIEGLQQSTQAAVNTMETCHSLADSSVQHAVDTSLHFDEIQEAIRQISDMSVMIATATEEQSTTTTDIKNNTDRISQASQHVLDESEQSLSKASVLESQSNDINQMMQQFQTQS